MNSSSDDPSRELYHVPIVHTLADMGGMADSVRQVSLQWLTVKAWRHKLKLIEQFWDRVEQAIEDLKLCYDQVRLYQDGLPVCGKEIEIVTTLADQGSRNHKLLLALVQKGARLMGTESPELLLEEYQTIKAGLESRQAKNKANPQIERTGSAESLLMKRDQFIAGRINATLKGGEKGLLFLGALHSAGRFLDQDILLVNVL
jgi:hypothetical protein